MSKPIPLDDYIALGQSVMIVANPQPWHVDLVAEEISKMLQKLKDCELVQTSIAANPLATINLEYNRGTNLILANSLRSIEGTMKSVVEVLFDEASKKQVVVIHPNDVSKRLREVPQVLPLTAVQEHLRQEAILDLERGAYRSAAVMGWCFVYDIIRYWVFSDKTRLDAFNAELAKHVKANGNRVYEDIVNYDDFFSSKAPGEFRVIELCEAARLFGNKETRKLIHCLDMRNDYAHASATYPTASQANALIESLLDIVQNPPFLQPPPPSLVTTT